MKGDILIIKDHHKNAAKEIVNIIHPEILNSKSKYIITVSGESGAGKSEVAESIAGQLKELGINSYIFQQDDFFIYPPKTNAAKRKEDINHVGIHEVKMDLLEEILIAIQNGVTRISKPLVIFDEDRIIEETVDLNDKKVIIVEGTYTTTLKHVNHHIFIDRNIYDTRRSRQERGREVQDEYLEKILLIEHDIISAQKALADIIVNKDYNVNIIK